MRITTILVSLIILALTSCHKHEELIAPVDNYEYGDLYKLFRYNLEDIKVIEPFDAEKGLKYAINNKAEVNIPANSLTDANGNKIKGKAELSFIEIYDMGTMAITNIISTADYNILKPKFASINLSMFFLEVLQNNQTVTIENAEILIPKQLTNWKKGDYEAKMIGKPKNEDIIWFSTTDHFTSLDNIFNFGINYSGWQGLFNFSRLRLDNESERISFANFSIPYGLNARNSRIFVAIEGIKGLLVDDNTLLFSNLKYHFILVVANKNSDGFYYAIKESQELERGEHEKNKITFKKEELKKATTKELKDIINKLP